MGKRMSGPDIADSVLYLKAVDRAARCKSDVLLTLAGSSDCVSVVINICSLSDDATLEGPRWVLSTSLSWPNRECATFEGALFRAVVDHDKELSRRHFQEILEIA